MKLSIVIPAHNEEQRIGTMLDAYLPFFANRYGDDVEFIVVVNGSTDATARVVEDYVPRFPQLRTLLEPSPIGKGGAVILGFREARGVLVGYVDADGSTPPAAFEELVAAAADRPIVIASRWCRGARVEPAQPPIRRIASRLFNLSTRILFGLRLTDTQCGAKVLQRDAVERILPHIGITKWAFDVDLLFQARRAGFAIQELSTTWHDVAGSKIAVTEASLEMLAALARLRLIYSPLRWVVRVYDRYLANILPSTKSGT
jgi:glycosyltransferase involved in cell wall biosynthesis